MTGLRFVTTAAINASLAHRERYIVSHDRAEENKERLDRPVSYWTNGLCRPCAVIQS